MAAVENYYAILEVAQTASDDEVRQALRSARRRWIARQNSPVHERRIEAERTVRALDEAERILLNPSTRQRYDADLQAQAVDAAREEQAREAEGERRPESTVDEAAEWIERAERYLSSGSAAAAVRAASEAISEDKRNPAAWAIRGQANLVSGRLDDAEFDLLEATQRDRRNVDLYIKLSECRQQMNRFEAAFAALQEAYSIEPDSFDVHLAMAACYSTSGNPKMGVDLLDRLLATNLDNDGYKWALAIALVDAVENSVATQLGDNAYTYASKPQIDEAEALLARASSLIPSPADRMSLGITGAQDFLTRMKGKSFAFVGSVKGWAIGLVVAFVLFLISPIIGILALIGIGAGFYLANFRPRWQRERTRQAWR